MASSVSEEQLLCCICLDVFTDPVSTPCGHNFCKKCLGGYWDNSNSWQCPLCNKGFENRPDLSVNTFISETAAQFRKSAKLNASTSAEENPTKLSKVLCDACTGVKEKSVKFCLNCGASYCKTHLEPHKNIQILKKHKLINPVENVEHYICQKHERPLELFCRDDQTCVCLFCTVTDHKTHNTVPIEEASSELKAKLEKTQTEIHKMIQDRLEKTEEIKHTLELSKKSTDAETASGVEVFTALIHSIERSQAELTEVMEEKQKAAEKQAEDLIKELEQEITELKRRNTELEQLFHTEDHLHLLQIHQSSCRPPHTKSWTNIRLITHSSVEILGASLSQAEKTLNTELKEETQKIKKRSQQKPAGLIWFMENWTHIILLLLSLLPIILAFLVSTKMWIRIYSVDVTLDPDTAHPKLVLSDDGKQVTHGDIRQNLPDNPKRFDRAVSVLGKQGFSSGRFYYEVQVSGKTEWDVGVARESVNRKRFVTYNPKNGFWTLVLRNGKDYFTAADKCFSLSSRENLQKVGVFVDYDEGLVSFYNAETKSHIYSFTGQIFTEKLFPCFSPCNNDGGRNSAPLIISDGYKGLNTASQIFHNLALLFKKISLVFDS